MKNSILAGITVAALSVAVPLTTLADGGNQLMQNQTHWYQKAALKVAPADITTKKGSVLNLQAGSYLYLEGDSTLHKYQMNANSLKGSAEITAADPKEALEKGKVGAMSLVVPVADLKSRESGLDDNAHKALLADKNPEIKFVLDKASLKGKTLTAKGQLTIAGATVPITLTPEVTVKDGVVELKGDQPLKMSDYKVMPPSISLLVTSIKCTDDITIHYDVKFATAK
ncbi:MAG TPA: YceI family protein [bacterium]|nr:YceI family protein [bacterium]